MVTPGETQGLLVVMDQAKLEALKLAVQSFEKYTQQSKPEFETRQITDRAEEFHSYLVGGPQHAS